MKRPRLAKGGGVEGWGSGCRWPRIPSFDPMPPTTHYLSIFQSLLLPLPPNQYPLSPSLLRLLHYPSTILYISSSLTAYQHLLPPPTPPPFFIFKFSFFPYFHSLPFHRCSFFSFHNAPLPSKMTLSFLTPNLQSFPSWSWTLLQQSLLSLPRRHTSRVTRAER